MSKRPKLIAWLSGSSSITKASIILAVSAILSNVLGLVRNLVFYRFIAPEKLDIYFASFRIPDFLFNIVIFGAVSSAFVPIVSELINKKKDEDALNTTNELLTWLTIIFALVGIVLAVFMAPLMQLVVHGFDPSRLDQAVHLSRILLFQSVLFAWSFTFGGFLNSSKRFGTFALAPLLYNTVLIIGGVLAAYYGINALGYAVVIGAIAHCGIQAYEAWKTGYRPRWRLVWSKEIAEITKLMIPRSLSQGMSQLVIIVFTALASGLQAGSIAIFSGMNDLQTTPTMVVANSLAVAAFPTLSALSSEKNYQAMNDLMTKVFRVCLYLLLPSLALTFVLRAQIVRLYFGIGGASWDLTTLAIGTFVAFLVGVIPASLVAILSRVFYSTKNTATPLLLSSIAGVTGIIWAVVSITLYHGTVVNLAVATSVVSIVQCILYIYVLNRHANLSIRPMSLFPYISGYIVSSTLLGFATWVTLHFMDQLYRGTNLLGTEKVLGLFIQLLVAATVGLIVFLRYSRLAHKEELTWVLTRRFSQKNL